MKVNRELIDADFEGYKLSLDTIPTYSTQFPAPLQIPTPADEQVSSLFLRVQRVQSFLPIINPILSYFS